MRSVVVRTQPHDLQPRRAGGRQGRLNRYLQPAGGRVTPNSILDTTGTAPFARCETALKPGGRLVVVQGTFAQALGMERPSKASGKKVITGVVAVRVEDLHYLAKLAEAGEFKPVIDRSYPLANAAEAHAYVDKGRKRGNVVMTVEHASNSHGVAA